jgi:hypothetical protein
MSDYRCIYCFKEYSNRQNLYRHKKKCKITTNDSKSITTDISTSQIPQKTSKNLKKSSQSLKIPHKNETINDTHPNYDKKQLECQYCSRILSRIDNLHRHYKTCKKKKEYELELYSKDDVMKEIRRVREEMLEMINKNFKIHPKKFEKMQRELNTINIENQKIGNTIKNNTIENNIQNQQNIQNNNININIIPLGKEDFINSLDKETQKQILSKTYDSIKYFLDITHFNPDTPQYRSFAITNTQNNIAHVYNDETMKFEPVTKDDLMFNLIHERGCDMRDMIELNKDELRPITVSNVNKFINRLDTDTTYSKKKGNELKVHIYNKTKNMDSKIKQLLV